MQVETLGSGPRIVLVHGSVGSGGEAWEAQRPLAERFTLVVVNRPGFWPNPPVERVDFEEHARLLAPLIEPGTHLVGHSYGGVIALYAAVAQPALGSLTVLEPPAFGIARGRRGVDELVDALAAHWTGGPPDPRAFLAGFSRLVSGREPDLPDPLPPEAEQNVRTLMVERPPSEADPPLDDLARAPYPKLVVSGAHHPGFDAVCDVLEERLDARRAVLPGAGHAVQRLGEPFNALLTAFLERAAGSTTARATRS